MMGFLDPDRSFLLFKLGVDHFLFGTALLSISWGSSAARGRRLSCAVVHLVHGMCGLIQFFDRLVDGCRVVAVGLRFHLGHGCFNCRLRAGVEFIGMLLEHLFGLVNQAVGMIARFGQLALA